jgi:hypothetical protein
VSEERLLDLGGQGVAAAADPVQLPGKVGDDPAGGSLGRDGDVLRGDGGHDCGGDLACDPGRPGFYGPLDPGCPCGARGGERGIGSEQVADPGLVQTVTNGSFQRRGDAGQRVTQAAGQPRLIRGQIDVVAVEHPQRGR